MLSSAAATCCVLPILSSILFGRTYANGVPIQMTWSNKTYGPDGPWSAIKIGLGNPPQQIDLIPGGFYSIRAMGASICEGLPQGQMCWAERAGLYSPDNSTTMLTGFDSSPNTQTGDHIGTIATTDLATSYVDQVTLGYSGETPLQNTSILLFEDGYGLSANGTEFPLTIGSFPLGGPLTSLMQGFNYVVNDSIPSSTLYRNGVIPSASFGMHLGSVEPYVPPSFWFGGYDKSRLLGPVATQTYVLGALGKKVDRTPPDMDIELLDIEIGMAPDRGPSPFNFTTMPGLLAAGNESIINSLTVRPNSANSGIYLPPSTCEAITALLPVTYRNDLNLYTWNTEDPLYQQIVRSPSFLSFIFNNGGENVTINVPFLLLNLTLSPPLVPNPISYFPFKHVEASYSLGRPFLQASFWGVNWEIDNPPGVFWLAQAPGPEFNRTPQVLPIGSDDGRLQSDTTTDWYTTWDGHWEPLAPPKHGLSTAAQVGIGVGIVIAVLLKMAGLTFFFVRRRRRKLRASEKVALDAKSAYESSPSDSEGPGSGLPELEPNGRRAEMPENPVRHEMFAGHGGKVYLPGDTLNPAEMEGDGGVHAELPSSSHSSIQRTPLHALDHGDPRTTAVPQDSQTGLAPNGNRMSADRDGSIRNEPEPHPLSKAEKLRLWKQYNGVPSNTQLHRV